MRNSVILVDQIEQDIRAGHSRFEAIVGATVRRFRPITLTAAAAVLALTPLQRSNFFGPMATALMGGITVATVLTLFYLPALYSLWFSASAATSRPRGSRHEAPSSLARRRANAVAGGLQRLRTGAHPAGVAAARALFGGGRAWDAGVGRRREPASGGATFRPVAEWWRAYECAALDAFVAEGLAHSSSLAAARGTLKAAREQLRGQIGGNMLPSVDLEFDPSRQRTLGIPIIPQQTFLENIFVAQVQTSYTFDFFGAALLADRALAQQVRQQALQFESTRRALATNIVVAVINAASLQGQVDETVELVALGEHRAAQASARYERGSATQDEALAAVQDAASAAATLPPLRAQALAVRHTLAVLLGRMPDQAPASLSLSDLHLPAALPLAVPSELLHQRPDILAAEAAVRAAADAAGAATASMFPSLTLSAAYGRGGFDWSYFTSPIGAIWTVGASLTQPVFHGGALLARRRQYRATYDAAVAQYKQTVLSAFEKRRGHARVFG